MTLSLTRPSPVEQPLGQTAPSGSAQIVCAMRAVDTLLPEGTRLVDDPAATHFVERRSYRMRYATPRLARLTARVFDWRYPGYMGIVLLRQRYWDAALREALAAGVDQVIVLGAGFDTTIFRHELSGVDVYEVDAAPTQSRKRAAIRAAGLEAAGNVRWVECDFEHQATAARLLENGFDPARRSITVWYGVTFFISETAVTRALGDLATISAPGSILVWDYIYRSVWDGSTSHVGARRARQAMINRHEPYRFGVDREDAAALVAKAGYRVVDHATLPSLGRRFSGPAGPWCRADDIVGVMTVARPHLAR